MKKFKIGGVPEHFNFPWRQAIEEKSFETLDVTLHWSDMTGGTGQMIKGLETGTLDIAVLLTEGITKAILQGTKAKILDLYVNSPLQWGIHVPLNRTFQRLKDLSSPKIAISRHGSGSHLMSYVLAQQENWENKNMNFNVIGDVYGGIWALENKEADIFLWEKYTTQPFVDKGSCERIGQVNTPWPCFVIACRADLLNENRSLLHNIISLVKQQAERIKHHPNAVESIAWRYHLATSEVEKWLQETSWNVEQSEMGQKLDIVIEFLLKADLITPAEAQQWESKLF